MAQKSLCEGFMTPILLSKEAGTIFAVCIRRILRNELRCDIPGFGIFSGIPGDRTVVFLPHEPLAEAIRRREIYLRGEGRIGEWVSLFSKCQEVEVKSPEFLRYVLLHFLDSTFCTREKRTVLFGECELVARFAIDIILESIANALVHRKRVVYNGLGIFESGSENELISFDPSRAVMGSVSLYGSRNS